MAAGRTIGLREVVPRPRRRHVPAAALVALISLALAAPASGQAPAATTAADPPRRHELALLGLFVSPTGDPVDEVYGSHAGAALRYTYRLAPRWSLAGEIGSRQADGTTPGFGFPAELDVLHAAATASRLWGPGVDRADRWTASLGAGVILLDVEEEVRFLAEPVTAGDTLTGLLLHAGARWPLRPSWGLTAEARYTAMEDAESPGPGLEPADFGALEVAAGVFVAF
jgi:hypothetical protein